MTSPVDQEQHKKKPSTTFDEIYTADYAKMAERILEGEVTEQGSSPLTNTLRTSSEGVIISPEGFTEEEVMRQLKKFFEQFSEEQIGLAAIQDLWLIEDFAVEYDEEELSYIITRDGLPVETLDLSGLELTNVYIPPAMSSINYLDIGDNKLTALPKIPSTVTFLYCGGNELVYLSGLPENLMRLDCYSNKLIALPTLPSSIQVLICRDNNLRSVPSIPLSVHTGNFMSNPLAPQTKEQLRRRGFVV